MPLNTVSPLMTSGLLQTSNGLSELAGTLATGYANTGYSAIPLGCILPYSGATASAPSGFAFCNGQAVSRTTFVELYALVGDQYGAGDGTTTFNLPDLRGRSVAGRDNMGGTAANRVTTAGSGINGVALGANGGSQSFTNVIEVPNDLGTNVVTSANNNMQPTIILNYIIKTNVNVVAVP